MKVGCHLRYEPFSMFKKNLWIPSDFIQMREKKRPVGSPFHKKKVLEEFVNHE